MAGRHQLRRNHCPAVVCLQTMRGTRRLVVSRGDPGPAVPPRDRLLMVCKSKPLSGNSWAENNRIKRDLATIMGNATAGRDGHLRIPQRLLQSAPPTLSIGLKKPDRLRKKKGSYERFGRHKSGMGLKRPRKTGQSAKVNPTNLKRTKAI